MDNGYRLETAFREEMEEEYARLLENTEKHEFTPKFEKEMNKLIRRQKKPYFRMTNTKRKRILCVLLAALIAAAAAVMSVEALRTAFFGFFISKRPDYSVFEADTDSSSSDKLEEIYDITYDLSDYTIYFEECDDIRHEISYKKGDDIQLDYTQYVKSEFVMNINTEGAELHDIEIQGKKAIYFCDKKNYDHIVWDNGEYVILLSSNIGKEELTDIANSITKTRSKKYRAVINLSPEKYIHTDNSNVPETINEFYEITYDSIDYKIKSETFIEGSYNLWYDTDDTYMSLFQYTEQYYKNNCVDEEDTYKTETAGVSVNGKEAEYYIDIDGQNCVLWRNEGYVFKLTSGIDKNTLIEIANSVQKVK